MRKISKHQIPACLQTFIDSQLSIQPEPVNLTYNNFRDKAELLAILTIEQFGLCGYTGAPVDERISRLSSPSGEATFKNHIEHMKCQDECKKELVQRGGEYGRDICDDLDHHNMIAALEVRGSEPEHFGAVKKKNKHLPLLPTLERCEECFQFSEGNGSITGLDDEAETSIKILDLNHDTLKWWRKAAIEAWLDPDIVKSREDFKAIKQIMELPNGDKLPEYAFVICSIVKEYL